MLKGARLHLQLCPTVDERGERWWSWQRKRKSLNNNEKNKPLRSLIRPQCQIALSAITQAGRPSVVSIREEWWPQVV